MLPRLTTPHQAAHKEDNRQQLADAQDYLGGSWVYQLVYYMQR